MRPRPRRGEEQYSGDDTADPRDQHGSGTARGQAKAGQPAYGDRCPEIVEEPLAEGCTEGDEVSADDGGYPLWMLTGVELYLAATGPCGWSDAEYGQWITESLQDQLLAG